MEKLDALSFATRPFTGSEDPSEGSTDGGMGNWGGTEGFCARGDMIGTGPEGKCDTIGISGEGS